MAQFLLTKPTDADLGNFQTLVGSLNLTTGVAHGKQCIQVNLTSGASCSIAYTPAGTPEEYDIVALIRIGATANNQRFGVGGSLVDGALTGYGANAINDDVVLTRFVDSNRTTLERVYSNGGNATTEWVWYRLRKEGAVLKSKYWRETEAEPATWEIEQTDPSTPLDAGFVGLIAFQLSGTDYVAELAIGTNGDEAPRTFRDSFDGTNGTDLENNTDWTRVDGVAGALDLNGNGELKVASTTETAYLSPDHKSPDHFVEATFLDIDSGSEPFIAVRATDKVNYIGARCYTPNSDPAGNVWQLYRRESAGFTLLAEITQVFTVGDVCRLEALGSTLRMYVNDVLIATAEDSFNDHVTTSGLISRGNLKNPWIGEYASGLVSLAAGTKHGYSFDTSATPLAGFSDYVQSIDAEGTRLNYPQSYELDGYFGGGGFITPPTTFQGRNRTGWTGDARLNGLVQTDNSNDPIQFRVDLPKAGRYKVRLAGGDYGFTKRTYLSISDFGIGERISIAAQTDADNVVDAAGNIHAYADWVANNEAVEVDFKSGTVQILLGDTGTDSDNSALNYIEFEYVSPIKTPRVVGTNSASTTAAFIELTHGFDLQDGDTILALINHNNASAVVSNAHGFSEDFSAPFGGNSATAKIYSLIAGSSEPASYRFDLTVSERVSLTLLQVRDADVLDTFNVAPASTFTGTIANSSSSITDVDAINVSRTNCLALVGMFADTATAMSISNTTNGYEVLNEESGTQHATVLSKQLSSDGDTGAIDYDSSLQVSGLFSHFAINPADTIAPDLAAPTLSLPTGAATGATSGSGTVSTTEAGGTLYTLESGNASELASTIIASGQTQDVTELGVQTVVIATLTPSTSYRFHYVHVDSAGNISNVQSSPLFTTDAAGSFWTPAEIATLAWYKADDASTITESGGSVSEWRDKSGNGLHAAQSVSNIRPITGTETLNGKNVISFEDDELVTAATALLNGRTSLGVILVFENDQSSLSENAIVGTSFSGDSGFLIRIDVAGFGGGGTNLYKSASETVDSGNQMETSSNSAFAGSQQILMRRWEQGFGNEFRIDGETDTPTYNVSGTTSTISNANQIILGNGNTGRLFGNLAEVIYFDGLSTEIEKLEGYLAHEWGLQANLPAGHPYKDSAPTVGGGGNEQIGVQSMYSESVLDSVNVNATDTITVDDLVSNTVLDSVNVNATDTITVDSLVSTTVLDSVSIDTTDTLGVESLVSLSVLDAVNLNAHDTINVDSLYSETFLDSVNVTENNGQTVIGVQSMYSESVLDSVDIQTHDTLAVDNMVSVTVLDSVAVSDNLILGVESLYSDVFVDQVTITTRDTLGVESLVSDTTLDTVDIATFDVLGVENLVSLTFMDSVLAGTFGFKNIIPNLVLVESLTPRPVVESLTPTITLEEV